MEDIYNGRFYYFTWRQKGSHYIPFRLRYHYWNHCNNSNRRDTGIWYLGEKVTVDSAVTLSDNSDIGKPTVKKYTDEQNEIILGIAVNDPVTMTGGRFVL